MTDNILTTLKNEEKAIFNLRSLYKKYGYLPFKMSKFEEYELYMNNKDFLVSDRIISFNDTNGKLLALKPDVTLSIIKSSDDKPTYKQKVYYDENVYRVSPTTKHFKEIMQAGLECIGNIDFYDIFEVITLAARSLMEISESFVLEISHLGVLSDILDRISIGNDFSKKAVGFISEKNIHDLTKLCDEYNIAEEIKEKLTGIIKAYGDRKSVIEKLDLICSDECECLNELKTLSEMLDTLPYSDKIKFDFSLVNDMNYYNGFVFKGFIDGIFDGVLAGGQYDKMMEKMGKKSGAIGFALYLDMLDRLDVNDAEYDIDVLLLYNTETPINDITKKVSELTEKGLSVSVQKVVPPNIRCREIVTLGKEGSKC